MAYRELEMVELREIGRRWQGGEGVRAIAGAPGWTARRSPSTGASCRRSGPAGCAARAACDFGAPTITVRVADLPPGEAAEADFGVLGLWHDPATGRRRRVFGLLVTLAYSLYAFLAITLRQDLGCLGGPGGGLAVLRRRRAPPGRRQSPAGRHRADRYTPGLNRVFLEYAQHRGFVVDPWARLLQAQKLLRLTERYGAARVNAACALALATYGCLLGGHRRSVAGLVPPG